MVEILGYRYIDSKIIHEIVWSEMMKMKNKHIVQTFRGSKFQIYFRAPKNRNHLGTCCAENKEIEIRPNQIGKDMLSCIIHESLHACYPDLVDVAIDDTAESIAILLWKLGYRVKDET